MSIKMFMLGLFLLGVGAGTSDNGHFLIGAGIAFKGLGLMFFSFEEHRNPNWLRRQGKYLLWKLGLIQAI